jgi:putative ABC transport system permease protein
MSSSHTEPGSKLKARPLMRPHALVYFYRRRLRVHAAQEALAALGVAVAVALIFATLTAGGSVGGSAGEVVHTVIGPANLQIAARGPNGFEERLLRQVERLRAVERAAPLLEQTAGIEGPNGRRLTIDVAGADTSLVVLDGLAHRLPIATLAPGGLGISTATAEAIGITARPANAPGGGTAAGGGGAAGGAGGGERQEVTLDLRGTARRLKVSAVLGGETFGALAQADVAVMPLARLQRLAGLRGRISRILVQSRPGKEAQARAQLEATAAGREETAKANQEIAALHQALRPSDEASGFFAAIAALLGALFAFNALLLTVPERRRAIADLRLIGTRRPAIVQMLLFQAICLGVAASLVGLAAGWLLSMGVFHISTRYLAEAFTLGTQTVFDAGLLALAFAGGVAACCLASAVLLLDLRANAPFEGAHQEKGNGLVRIRAGKRGSRARGRGASMPRDKARSMTAPTAAGLAAAALTATATALFLLAPELALGACAALATATLFAVPPAFAAVLRTGRKAAEKMEKLTILPVALSSLKATPLRSLALAGTGAVAIFGSVALGGGRGDLLRGIQGFARSYAADAQIWVSNPGDNQATVEFGAGGLAPRIAKIPGVAGVRQFQGGFVDIGNRRVWIVARPPGGDRQVLASQIIDGGAANATEKLDAGGWIAISKEIAEEDRLTVGSTFPLPTPGGQVNMKIAALTTNLAWSPGVIFMSKADYERQWSTTNPTALAIDLAPGRTAANVRAAIEEFLGPNSGLEVATAREREAAIDAIAGEGLSRLGEISTLLLIAAILALAAALTSAIWQRRVSMAALRLAGVRAHRLRLILAIESALILTAGCVTGAVAGIYGQLIIDRYLRHVTGFPVANIDASLGATLRPLEILALVVIVVLGIAAVPGIMASRVSPTLALNE